jgi:serine/threonine protein kinase
MRPFGAGRFILKKKLGAGSFGEIYQAEDTKRRQRVAIKLEAVEARFPQLAHESRLYSVLQDCVGVPRLFWYGTEGGQNGMAISLLDKSLDDLTAQQPDHRLSLKTVLMLVPQMLTCVEQLHRRDLIHRDIKPENFAMGTGADANRVFIIDFGLAKRFRSRKTGEHIPYIEGKDLTGTARYASVAALRGSEQSRRDDMEALGFVWLFLLRGSLPWMGLGRGTGRHKYDRILKVKAATSFEDLCAGFPDEFARYLRAVRELRFQDEPDYAAYRKMFRKLFLGLGYVSDGKYDWCATARPVRSKAKTIGHSSARVKKPSPPAGAAPARQLVATDRLPAAVDSSNEPARNVARDRKTPRVIKLEPPQKDAHDSTSPRLWKVTLARNGADDSDSDDTVQTSGWLPRMLTVGDGIMGIGRRWAAAHGKHMTSPPEPMPDWMRQTLASRAAPRKF